MSSTFGDQVLAKMKTGNTKSWGSTKRGRPLIDFTLDWLDDGALKEYQGSAFYWQEGHVLTYDKPEDEM